MTYPSPEDLPHYSYDDYLQWEGRWELINGIPYAMSPAPGIAHQTVSQHIASQLERALEHCTECHALLPVDWKINEATTVQPDNLVVCGPLAMTAYLRKAPALIFEIISKATAHKDRTTKFRLYEQEGVPYYVIVDPTERLAKVYRLHEGRYRKVLDAGDDTMTFDLGPCSLPFDFERIWP